MGWQRRHLLAAVGATATGALAGCPGPLGRAGEPCAELDRRRPPTIDRSQLSLPVPESALIKAAPKDGIRAITEPTFAPDWSDLDERLGEPTSQGLVADDLVIGVERDGRARAYPLQVLYTHEIVNDAFGGPLLVSYCPICGSSVAAERTVDGEATVFGVSGYLWKSDLVMYDRRTESLWSQIAATAIRGPRTGDRLELVPSTLTTWASWRETRPDTEVLLPPPLSTALGEALRTPYYLPYARDQVFSDRGTGELDENTAVKGLVVDGHARAYPFPVVQRAKLVNDRLGGHPVLIAASGDARLVAYDRCVDGQTLTFAAADEGFARAGGSRWRLADGVALDGPYERQRLSRLAGQPPMFWSAWRDFHPETDVYGIDRSAGLE